VRGNRSLDILTRATRRLAAALVCFLAFILSSAPLVRAQEAGPSEYQVKAAFLFNFAKFVEWPTQTLAQAGSPFIIGVIGENPFDGDLEQTVKGKSVNGHPFEVKQIKALSELKGCHILFISKSERGRLPEILNAISTSNVLTVSEMDRFLQSGGMINFVREGNKIRFEINDDAARQAGLRISSKLLNLARRTEPAAPK
jgi:hypothetical protein